MFGGRQSAWHLVASGGAAAEGGVCQPAAAQGGGKVTQCFPGCPPVRENELPTRRQVPGEATAEKPAEVISGRKHQTARHSVKSRRWVGKQGRSHLASAADVGGGRKKGCRLASAGEGDWGPHPPQKPGICMTMNDDELPSPPWLVAIILLMRLSINGC